MTLEGDTMASLMISKFIEPNTDIEREVLDIEKKYNISLPEQYKGFLLKYNGGYTPKTGFRVARESSDLRGFYGVGNAKMCYEDWDLEEWIEKKLFPIACDSFGNYILIGLEEKDGKIYFADHEKGYATKLLTDDLKQFIKCCKSEVVGPEFTEPIEEREKFLIARGRGHIICDELRKIWQAEIDKYKDIKQEKVLLN